MQKACDLMSIEYDQNVFEASQCVALYWNDSENALLVLLTYYQ